MAMMQNFPELSDLIRQKDTGNMILLLRGKFLPGHLKRAGRQFCKNDHTRYEKNTRNPFLNMQFGPIHFGCEYKPNFPSNDRPQ